MTIFWNLIGIQYVCISHSYVIFISRNSSKSNRIIVCSRTGDHGRHWLACGMERGTVKFARCGDLFLSEVELPCKFAMTRLAMLDYFHYKSHKSGLEASKDDLKWFKMIFFGIYYGVQCYYGLDVRLAIILGVTVCDVIIIKSRQQMGRDDDAVKSC